MSFTVHVTLVTTPELFGLDVRNYIKDNFQGSFERTRAGDFYKWSMHNKAIHDEYVYMLFDFARRTTDVAVRMSSPEVNNEVEIL